MPSCTGNSPPHPFLASWGIHLLSRYNVYGRKERKIPLHHLPGVIGVKSSPLMAFSHPLCRRWLYRFQSCGACSFWHFFMQAPLFPSHDLRSEENLCIFLLDIIRFYSFSVLSSMGLPVDLCCLRFHLHHFPFWPFLNRSWSVRSNKWKSTSSMEFWSGINFPHLPTDASPNFSFSSMC